MSAKVRWGMSWEKFAEFFRNTPQSFPAGEVVNYEHSENVILGEILHRVSGLTAQQLVNELIAAPSNIALGPPPDKSNPHSYVGSHAYSAATGKYASSEFAPFGPFWAASLPNATLTLQNMVDIVVSTIIRGEKSPIARSAIEKMCRPIVAFPKAVGSDPHHERTAKSFGLGCGLYGDGLKGHNASINGQTCAVRFDIGREIVIAIAVNTYYPYARDIVIRRIADAIYGTRQQDIVRPGDVTAFELSEMLGCHELNQISGTYLGSLLGEIKVEVADGVATFIAGSSGRPQKFNVRPFEGRYFIDSPFPMTLGVFSNPFNNDPALALGVHTYAKYD
jgi:CubicO group peptidase (beta-lactamase class C family)